MDVQQIKGLVELMAANDISRMEIQEGDTHILLRRGAQIIHATSAHSVSAPAPMVGAPPHAAAPAAPAQPAAAPAAGEAETLIRSPMVGTFYVSPEPDAAPFIGIGSVIGPETVVCLVEAMKVFNEIKAETSGRISRILVKNAQAVEFDQPLFAVTPN